jgi:GT2 family glycosyltransferase
LDYPTSHLFEQDSLVLGRGSPNINIMNHPRVLVITLNWRQPHTTIECVQALKAMAYPNLQILVIDNGSGDGSTEIMRNHLPDITVLSQPENLGFAAGSNIGLRYAVENEFEYALLINNDAFPAPDMLEHLLAETTPEIALLSPKIYYENEPSRIWFANARQHPSTLDLRDTGRGQLDGSAWLNSRDVDYLLGTCLLVNLTTIAQLGFFDEQYFMYFEDLDWSMRLRQAGYRLRLVAPAHLYHRIATSSGGLDSPFRRYHLARSGVIFWRRHARLGQPWVIALFRLGSALKTISRLLLNRQPAVAFYYLRGLRDGWDTSSL